MDALAEPVRLNFRKQKSLATFRGGLISICVYAMTAYCSLNLVERFIFNEEPTIQFYEERLD